MNEWKEAFWLTRYALKGVKLNLLIGTIVTILFSLLLVKYMPTYFVGSPETRRLTTKAIDFGFIFPFIGLTSLIYGMKLNGKGITSGKYVYLPVILALNQLAIDHRVIVKHRLLLHNGVAIFNQLILLLILYMFSSTVRDAMDIQAYIIFSIIFMSFGLFVIGLTSIYDAGYKRLPIHIFIGLIVVGMTTFLYDMISGTFPFYGLIKLIADISTTHPILSTLFALTFAAIGWFIGQENMLRKMKRMDYL